MRRDGGRGQRGSGLGSALLAAAAELEPEHLERYWVERDGRAQRHLVGRRVRALRDLRGGHQRCYQGCRAWAAHTGHRSW